MSMDDDNNQIITALKRNSPYIRSSQQPYDTDLNVAEPGFQQWIIKNKVPFDPNVQGPSDYDMRGFYHGLMTGNPHAKQSVNPNDRRVHYSDYWKTPYHQSFSDESQWATDVAPRWNAQDQLISPSGKIIVDERNPYPQMRSLLTNLYQGS